ncbi:PfkB family carbohydrate kinase [Streptomyces sp. NBC_00490]|uniref:PfkB family carbohydrate kinase n=1 Tax=Streptomyces sp. NBC_00490 TaxID=2903657 RepID=UPI002E189AF3
MTETRGATTIVTNAPGIVDVVALGESMVTFLPSRPGRLADVPSFERGIGGAESNLACGLAAAGHSVRWVSRVGADGFGDHLVATVGSYGVDVSAVRRDPVRPTGVYFRTAGERGTDAHEVAYYRAGSAASAMSAENVDLEAVRAGRVLHLTGITAALSEGCRGLLHELTAPGAGRPLISFDVNHRPDLWRDAEGAEVVRELARRADVVFVGEDEAWGVTGGPSAVRELLPEPGVLVVKQGAEGATAFVSAAGRRGLVAQFPAPLGSGGDPVSQGEASSPAEPAGSRDAAGRRGLVAQFPAPLRSDTDPESQGEASLPAPAAGSRDAAGEWRLVAQFPAPLGSGGDPVSQGEASSATFVPALDVDVVATTGAGDAFAAGFLSGMLRGLSVKACLRAAHLHAAATLTTPGDLAVPPARDTVDRLAAVDDGTWGTLRLGPGWTQAVQAPEEVRIP